jgi:GntR family transcriptional regulator
MFIKIAPSSGIPLYRQIMAQIRLAVATGRVRPGDKLSSIRDLSQTLEISPITVVKAYNELEHMGVVETRRGRGTFVTEGGTLMGYDDRVRAAAELLEETALDLAALDLPSDTICEILREKLESFEKAKEGGSIHG